MVLLVPAVVDPHTSYQDAWTRSQRVIKERLLPLAAELQVMIAVEEVWNRFLLRPLEMARYVDELNSPWVKAYFDVGNVVLYGYPQDWIRTLGPRIVRVHLKDFSMDRGKGTFAWKNLGEGDIDWPAVRQAFADIGYAGYVTTELASGDAAYLADVSARVPLAHDLATRMTPAGGPMTPTPAPHSQEYATGQDRNDSAHQIDIIDADALSSTAPPLTWRRRAVKRFFKRHGGWENDVAADIVANHDLHGQYRQGRRSLSKIAR